MTSFITCTSCLVLLSAIAPPAAAAPADVDLGGDSAIVPMTHVNGHVGVLVTIGGEGPYRFQVDTHAGIELCIDDDVAEALDLPRTGTVQNSDGVTTRQRDLVAVDELRVGGVTFSGLRALVDDYDWVEASDGTPVRGLLGFPLFRELLVTFDYPGDRLVLERGDLDPVGDGVMPYQRANGVPDLYLRLGSERVLFGIDSGSQSTLELRMADADRFGVHGELRHVGNARTVYSEFPIYSGALAVPVRFAGHEMEPVFGTFAEGKRKRLIGYGLLRSYAVTFDQRRALVRFRRPPDPEPAVLTDAELDRWIGEYVHPAVHLRVARDEGSLLLYRDGGPAMETIPVSATELLLRVAPVRVHLAEDDEGRPELRVEQHPDRPQLVMRRTESPDSDA